MIRNVHTRALTAPVDEVGALLDSLGGDNDRLWPAGWPPLRFDRPLAVGASGGHGPVRYSVVAYEPGRVLTCRFAPGLGLIGTHRFDVEPIDEQRTVLRHVLEGRLSGGTRLLWPLAVRWLHDALLDDLLDRAQVAVEGRVANPARWSPWVRVLRAFFRRAPLMPRPQAERSRAPAVHAANSEA